MKCRTVVPPVVIVSVSDSPCCNARIRCKPDLDGVQAFEREVLEDFASGRGLNAAGMAFEQAHAEFGFQPGDVLAHRGLRTLQLARQRAHAAGLAGRDQDTKIFQGHGRHISICLR